MCAKIHVVKRTDHIGNRESRKTESESERLQVGGLNIFSHCAIEVWQQAAECHLALPLRLAHCLSRARLAEVIREAAFNRLLQAKLSIERHIRDTRRAPAVLA